MAVRGYMEGSGGKGEGEERQVNMIRHIAGLHGSLMKPLTVCNVIHAYVYM
jgi:hypothetical protein